MILPEEIAPQDLAVPPCPHFGLCGGCQLQHLAYAAQLALKAGSLRALLAAAGLAPPPIQLHPSPPLAYRNRIRLSLAEVEGRLRAGYIGNPVAASTSHLARTVADSKRPAFLAITECPVSAPTLWRATEEILMLLDQSASLWLRNSNQIPDQLELFTTADESRLQFTLYLRTAAKSLPKKLAADFATLCESLRTRLPELTGAGVAILPALSTDRSRRNEQPRPGPTWGSPGLTYPIPTQDAIAAKDEVVILSAAKNPSEQDEVVILSAAKNPSEQDEVVILSAAKNPSEQDEIVILSAAKNPSEQDEIVILSAAKNPRISPLPLPVLQPATANQQPPPYWVPRGAFFQVNRFLLPELLALVCSYPATANRSGDLAFDLYAGVGLFSRALADRFAQVTAVEIAEPAFTALASGSKTGKLPNLRAVKATTLDFLRAAVTERDHPDLIVLDPPRTGAGREVCSLLARIAAPTLIYISCSPETLSADLNILTASGYRIAELHLFDLFPQTTHTESVAILTL